MVGVIINWIRGDSAVGSLHMLESHNVSEKEVEQVLLRMPPMVEARRSRRHPGRTIFWGATRHDRWLFVSCDDEIVGNKRILTPITAFEPSGGRLYWEQE